MNKIIFLLCFLFLMLSCQKEKKEIVNNESIIKEINLVVDKWHKDVAEVKFDAYFNAMTKDAIFIGTDASENWTKQEFINFAKPHFDKKKTWNFKPLERNVYVSDNGKTVWFDELLDTWMRVCRGSGVLVKHDNDWKIKHYVLSTTIPNDSMKTVAKLKSKSDSIFIFKNFKQ